MSKMLDRFLNVEDISLLVVFCTAYVVQMYIQYDDPQIKLRRADYVIGFFCSCIGGFIAYKFIAYATENPGEIMFWTITASINSPRAFRFMANSKVQERLIESLFNRVTGAKKQEDDI